MEMLQRQDWVVPTFNGELRTDKPPLHYFFMMITYGMFGVSPFSARLFSVVFGVATTVLIFYFSRKLINEKTAFLSSLIFVCSIQVAIQFHLAVPDPYLIFFVTLGLFSFLTAYHLKQEKLFYATYFSCGVGFLAKGPLALILIGVPIFIYLLARKELNLKSIARMGVVRGVFIILIIVLPWLASVGFQTNGAWLRGFFLDHNISRFTATMEGHRGLPGIAIGALFLSLLPTSFFLPQSIWKAWQHRDRFPLLLFSIIVCAVVVSFFSFSKTFLPGYIAPCLPFAAVILGYFLVQWIDSKSISFMQGLSYITGALITIVIPVAAYLALRKEVPASSATMAFWLFPLLLGSLISLFFFFRRNLYQSVYVLLCSYGLSSILLFYFVIPELMRHNPIQTLLERKSLSHPIVFQRANPAFIFENRMPIPVAHTNADLVSWLKQYPDAVIIGREKDMDQIDTSALVVLKRKDLFETSVTVFLFAK